MCAAGGGVELGVRVQAIGCVVADRRQHHEARVAVRAGLPDQALVDERGEAVERVDLGSAAAVDVAGDGLDGLEGGAGERRQQLEQPLLARLEQLVAPLDRGAQRLLAAGRSRAPPLSSWRVSSSRSRSASGEKRLIRAVASSSGEGQAVEALGDLGDGGGVVVRELEVGFDGAGARDEELDRLVLRELFGGGPAADGLRKRERRNRKEVLSAKVQWLAARDEDLQPGAVLQELRHGRRRFGDLLEVVEDEERVVVAEAVADLVEDGLGGRGVEAEGVGDRAHARLRCREPRRGRRRRRRPRSGRARRQRRGARGASCRFRPGR